MSMQEEKKLSQIGSSWGVVIPAWFLKVLDIKPKSDLILSIENDSIVIRKKTDN